MRTPSVRERLRQAARLASPARFGTVLAMSAALAFVACAPAPAGPIKIGGLAPLTGPQSTFGEGARLGTGIAIRDINAAGGVLGRPLEIVMRDDEANPTKAVQAVQELVSNEKVSALIGPINTPSALAVAAPVGEAKLINFQITTGTATVDPRKSPTIFRPQYYASQEAAVMLDYALKTLGKKCPGILADSTGYGQGGVAELKAALDARGVKMCGEDQKYNSGDVDMTGQLSRIITSNADVILAWGLGHELANAALGLQKLGSPLKMVGASGITTVGFRALSKDAGAGHFGVYSKRFSSGEGVPADAKALNFVDQLDKFAGGPWEAQTIVSAPWHEAVYIYAQAVKDANSLDSDKVQAALEKMRNYPGTGIYTTYSFGPGERNGFQASDLTIVYAAEVQKGVYKRPPNAP